MKRGFAAQLRRGVPGPPRGRHRSELWRLRDRVETMRRQESAAGSSATAVALLRLARDVILLWRDLAVDDRVPARRKWAPVALAAAYVAAPLDVIPDDIPVLGHLDDALACIWAARRVLQAAGFEVIYEHWRGTDEGLAVVLTLARVDR